MRIAIIAVLACLATHTPAAAADPDANKAALDEKGARMPLDKSVEGCVDVAIAAGVQDLELQPKRYAQPAAGLRRASRLLKGWGSQESR